MTKAQRIAHKKMIASRCDFILHISKHQKVNSAQGNPCVFLSGVGQKGKYSIIGN